MIILEFDILICDEIMAVSDTEFKLKCIKKIIELKEKRKQLFLFLMRKKL